eukprot:gene4669-14866_t
MEPGISSATIHVGWQVFWGLTNPFLFYIVTLFPSRRGNRIVSIFRRSMDEARSDMDVREADVAIRQSVQAVYSAVALMATLLLTIQFGVLFQLGDADTLLAMFQYALLFDSIMSTIIALVISMHWLFALSILDNKGVRALLEAETTSLGQKLSGYELIGQAICHTDLAILWFFLFTALYLRINQSQAGVFMFWLTGIAMSIYLSEMSYNMLFDSQARRLVKKDGIRSGRVMDGGPNS